MPQFACFLFCTAPFPRKGTAQERYKNILPLSGRIFNQFSHIYSQKKHARPISFSGCVFLQKAGKKAIISAFQKVAGEAFQNRKIPRQHSFKGTTILLQLHVSIQQSGEQLLSRSPLFVLILSTVHPFAAGWISDFSGWFCEAIRFFLFRLHFFCFLLTMPR